MINETLISLVSDPLTEGRYQSETGLVESFMQIACPNCATSYEVGASSLGESGRTVRCAHCKETWFAEPVQFATADDGAAPSMWQSQDPQDGGWTARDGGHDQSIVPEDRFASQQPEVEFAPPQDMPEIATAPWITPDADADIAAAIPEPPPAPVIAPENSEPDLHEVRRRRQQRQAAKKPKKKIFTRARLIAACCVILVGLVLGRDPVARLMPQLASLYGRVGLPINLRGLAFENVKGIVEQQDAVSVLVIEGVIRNITRDAMEVPRLRFAIRNGADAEIYSWTALPERTVLPPGDTQVFRTRLASPPAEGRQAYVRFFQKRDIVASSQQR
jgi:predicted Zn finger-like uncharacterized protein